MTRFLVATASVHATAAACDYLTDRLGPDDEVHVLTVRAGADESDPRDAGDATNVATVRLAGTDADVRTIEREGEPAPEILRYAEEIDADELLLAAHDGPPGADPPDVGDTARRVLTGADRPVVVVALA